MNNLKILMLICLLGALVYFALSCSNSTGPDAQHDFPAPIDSVATDITLYVYSDIYDVFICDTKLSASKGMAPVVRIILDTIEMDAEGPITINIEETDPYTDPPRYFIYAEADGFYTELYYCTKGETITVDLDAVPELENSITGVLFFVPAHGRDEYYAVDTVILTGPDNICLMTMTDSQGRYGVGNLPLGTYILTDGFSLTPMLSIQQTNNPVTDYISVIFYEPTMDRAPYIYLYPESQSDISVELGLVPGGKIIESEPPYNNGWNVNVTPDGTIDEKYEYLYYESLQALPLDYRRGWVLDGADLENELRNLLSNLGFIEKEINDFLEFWIPKLGNADYFGVYPQDVESFVTLRITPQPDNILRTLLLIRPLAYQVNIPSPPEPEIFVRDGFTVAEWGVIWMAEQQ